MVTHLRVDGRAVSIPGDGGSLLDALRDHVGVTSVKDGCSPQGQCGCCTVLVDGSPRVACVTPLRRVAGQAVTTVDGLDPQVVQPLVDALTAAGASQCGFCTPGIVVRLAALGPDPAPARVESALLAHLCRCTGWRTIVDAACSASRVSSASRGRPAGSGGPGPGGRRPAGGAGGRRPPGRGSAHHVWGERRSPPTPRPTGAWSPSRTGGGAGRSRDTVGAARAAAGRVQGRRSGHQVAYPLDVAAGAVGADPAHHLGRTRLPGARRLVVRPRRRPGVARRQRRGVRGQDRLDHRRRRPAAGRRARSPGPRRPVPGGRRPPRTQAPSGRGRYPAGRHRRPAGGGHPRCRRTRWRRSPPA